jgi:hypothetical protein
VADGGPNARVAGVDRLSRLGDVLVVTVRKSFWASPEAERWPRRMYARVFYGHSTNLVNSLVVFIRALTAIWLRPPRVVLLGSVERTVPWFICAGRLGMLHGVKLVVTNQLNLSPWQLEQVERVIVHATAQATSLGAKGAFVPLAADGDLDAARRAAEPGEYVFSGGGAGRDFETLVEAVRGRNIRVELVVFAPDAIAHPPENVGVSGPLPQLEFLRRLASARIVVVPLLESDSPHGQTLVVQALALGKPVVATETVGLADYLEHERNALLTPAGDADALRAALVQLLTDDKLLGRLAGNAAADANLFSYVRFADRLASICGDVVAYRG